MEMHHKSLPEVTPRNNGGFNIKNVSVGYQRGYVASDYKKACHRSPGLHRSGHCLKPSWTGVQRIDSSLHTLSPEVSCLLVVKALTTHVDAQGDKG